MPAEGSITLTLEVECGCWRLVTVSTLPTFQHDTVLVYLVEAEAKEGVERALRYAERLKRDEVVSEIHMNDAAVCLLQKQLEGLGT